MYNYISSITLISKKIFYLILLLLITNFSTAQKWSGVTKIGIGGDTDRAQIFKSSTDKDGNTYVVGSYTQKLILGDKEYNGPNWLYNNFFVAKFACTGNVIWSNVFHGVNAWDNIIINKLFIDSYGNLYITGTTEEDLVFSDNIGLSLSHHEIYGVPNEEFICKYNYEGMTSWAKFVYGFVEVSDDGKIFTDGFMHNGFPLNSQWQDFRLTRTNDTLRWYNNYGVLENKVENYWQTFQYRSVEGFTSDRRLWGFVGSSSGSKISRFDPSTLVFVDDSLITNSEPHEISKTLIHDNSLFMLGTFESFRIGSVHFGNITINAKDTSSNVEHNEGYLVKYNLDTKDYDWGVRVDNMDFSFNRHLIVSNSGNIFVSSEVVGLNSPNYIHAFNDQGDLLWELSSTTFIHSNTGLGVDQYENLYVTGYTSNGSSNVAYFGDYSFTYDYTVGFLARIQNLPCQINAQIEISNGKLKAVPDLAKYQWVDCTSKSITLETSQTFSPKSNGSYFVRVSVSGCVSTSECVDYVILNTNENPLKDVLSVTQTQNQFILNSTFGLRQVESVRMLNASGACVAELKVKREDIIYIENAPLSNGLYIVQLIGQNYFQTIKIIKS